MQAQPVKEFADSKTNGDLFDSSINLEEAQLEEGYKEGFSDGMMLGQKEGREVGLKVGFEVGEKLGFYRGCVDAWTAAIRNNPSRFTPHIQDNVKRMDKLIKIYPVLDPENENADEIMESLRVMFKATSASLASTLSIKLVNNGLSKSSGAND